MTDPRLVEIRTIVDDWSHGHVTPLGGMERIRRVLDDQAPEQYRTPLDANTLDLDGAA